MAKVLLAAMMLLLAASCSDSDASDAVTVYAASSLTDAFADIAEAYEEHEPGTDVRLNFASSSALAAQINEGAPADVFASANATQVQVVVDAGNAAQPVTFATNELALAVPAGVGRVATFDDLFGRDVILVVAAPDVPAGALFRAAMASLVASGARSQSLVDALFENIASEEANVRAVLSRLQLDEADAGFVYSSDLASAGEAVRRIPIPETARLANAYPIAVVGEQPSEEARAFVAFVLSDDGQAILREHGFGAAP